MRRGWRNLTLNTKLIYHTKLYRWIKTRAWYNTDSESFRRRPLSVTIIAIGTIILGILTIIFGGLPSLGLAIAIPEVSGYLIGLGAVLLAIGIAYLVVSYGLMKGSGWAWSVTIILSYINIVFSIIAIVSGNFFSAVQLIISILIVFFLLRSGSKAFFNKPPNAWV
jgi:hypothetical protein